LSDGRCLRRSILEHHDDAALARVAQCIAQLLAVLTIGNRPGDDAPYRFSVHVPFLGPYGGAFQHLLKRPMQPLGSLPRPRLIGI
jgi:hypothetical protein